MQTQKSTFNTLSVMWLQLNVICNCLVIKKMLDVLKWHIPLLKKNELSLVEDISPKFLSAAIDLLKLDANEAQMRLVLGGLATVNSKLKTTADRVKDLEMVEWCDQWFDPNDPDL